MFSYWSLGKSLLSQNPNRLDLVTHPNSPVKEAIDEGYRKEI
jgi:hypothetical protein